MPSASSSWYFSDSLANRPHRSKRSEKTFSAPRTCFSALAHCLANDGLRPVWGALSENEPSMRLAAKLGFRRVAGLVSFLRPDP